MAKKYIKQIINQNFIYPNDDVSEYDVEIVHDINNNCVSGTVTSFSATTVASTGITFTYGTTWALNGAEPFIRNSNVLSIYSIHMLAPGQNYYKPWRLVQSRGITYTGQTTYSETGATFSVTASQAGISGFTNGTYYFEVRFIGHRAIFPVCVQLNVSTLSPTPTPTPTSTPTPTPTVTIGPTPTPVNYTSGATINVTDTGWIKYNMSSGSTYQFISSLGNNTLTSCLDCASLMPGIPFADVAAFTVTNCGNSCSAGPTPTPTPTTTGCTGATAWRINNSSNGYDVYWSGYSCEGLPLGGTVGAYSVAYTTCVADGTLTYTGFPIVTVDGYC